MKNYFKKTYFLLIIFLIISLCANCGCSGGSGLTSDTGGDAVEAGSLISDQPVDIPLPVAKTIQGVDPLTLVVDSNDDSGSVTLSGQTLSQEQEYMVVVIDEAVVGNAVATDASGIFSVSITTDQLGTPIALLVAGDGSVDSNGTVDTGGVFSLPIIVTIGEELGENGEYPVTVTLTNTNSTMTGADVAANLLNMINIAFNPEGTLIATRASTSDGNQYLATVDAQNGEVTLVGDLTSLGQTPIIIKYRSGSDSIYWHSPNGVFYETDTNGDSTELISSFPSAGSAFWAFSPDGTQLAAPGGVGDNLTLDIYDMTVSPPTVSTKINFAGASNVNRFFVDWMSDSELIVSLRREDSTNELMTVDTSSGNTLTSLVTNSDTSDQFFQVAADQVNNRFIVRRGSESPPGDINTWMYDLESNTFLQLTSTNNMDHKSLVTAPPFGVDEIDVNRDDGTSNYTDNLIEAVTPTETICGFSGTNPASSPIDSTVVAYKTVNADTGNFQISIIDLDNITPCSP